MFRNRSYDPELMDDLKAGGDEMKKCLTELELVNQYLGGYSVTAGAMEKVIHKFPGQSFSFADAGCGGGDTLRFISRWAGKKGLKAELWGIDANNFIIQCAESSSIGYPIHYMAANVFDTDFIKQEFDIIHTCLFCHHFNDEDLLKMLRNFKVQARKAVIINDLHRHPLAYYSIKYITKFFSSSPLVKHDAPLSVLKAFREKELENLFREAGFQSFEINWKWAFRYRCILYP